MVKNLESNYRKVPGISAATILGDGSVALIVDVSALQAINREPVSYTHLDVYKRQAIQPGAKRFEQKFTRLALSQKK